MTTANISISLPLEVLESIDKRRGKTPRSRFIRVLLEGALDENQLNGRTEP